MTLIPTRPDITLGRKAVDVVTSFRGTVDAVMRTLCGYDQVRLVGTYNPNQGTTPEVWIEVARVRMEPGQGQAALITPLPNPFPGVPSPPLPFPSQAPTVAQPGYARVAAPVEGGR